jgi:hypothetical protein
MTTHLDANRVVPPAQATKDRIHTPSGVMSTLHSMHTHTHDSAAGGQLPEPFQLQLLGDLLDTMCDGFSGCGGFPGRDALSFPIRT